ncbi:MAG: PAS domain S-box protein [Pseudomonadota bacterium]
MSEKETNARPAAGRFGRISFLSAVLIPFTLLLVATVGWAGYVSFRNARREVNLTADRLRGEIVKRIKDHLVVFLETPHRVNELNADSLRRGLPDPRDQAELEGYFRRQINAFPTVTSIYFGNARGGLVNSGREGARGSRYVIVTDDFAAGTLRKFALDEHGNRAELLTTAPNYDARTRQWYTRAPEKGGPAWSPVYILSTGQDMAIAAARPVYDDQGILLGVASVDLFLSHLGDFLRHLRVGETGQAYIMERSGRLIASSAGESPFTAKNGGAPQRRLDAEESAMPLIRRSAGVLRERFGDFHKIGREEYLEFNLDGERQFLQTAAASDRSGLDWLVVAVIPERDFLAGITAQNRATALIILAALVVAVLLGFVAARGITRPIRRLNAAAQALAAGDRALFVAEDSLVRELSELTRSFNRMSIQLHSAMEKLKQENAERKQAEEALRESEERLSLALEGADLGAWDWTVPTGYVAFNQRWAEMLGYQPRELEPNVKTWEHFLHPEDREAVLEALNRHLRGDSPKYETEHRLRHKSGHWVWVLDKGKVIDRDENGAPTRVCGTHLDIGERKQVEEALRESEEKHRTFIENMMYGTLLTGPDGRIFSANQAARDMLGLTEAEIIGAGRNAVVDLDDPRLPAALDERAAKGKFQGELNFKKKNGPVFPVEISSSIYLDKTGREKTCIVFRDVTDRRQAEEALRESEEKYRKLFEHSPVGLGISSEDGELVAYNAAMLKQGGYSEEDMAKVDSVIGLYFHPEDRAGIMAKAARLGFLDEEEVRFRRKDGTPYHCLLSLGRVKIGGGSYWLAMVQDISERKKHEQEREDLIARLQSALEEVKTLRGFIPICANCKKIRDDEGYWQQIERYIEKRSEVQFSHSICPDCVRVLYPDIAQKILNETGDD